MIVVVEQNWVGHHPTYFSYIVHAAAQHSNVLALCPEPETAKRMVKEVGELSNPVEFEALDFILDEIPIKRKLPALYNLHLFSKVKNQLEEKGYDETIYVLFCCLYHASFPCYKNLEKVLPYSWSALMINADICEKQSTLPRLRTWRSLNPLRAYEANNCQSLFFLEHEKEKEVHNVVKLPLIEFPDICNFTLASEELLKSTIPELFDINSKLVGVLGHLSKSKSILELIRAAKSLVNRDWGIFVAGELNKSSFSDQEYNEILRFFKEDPYSLFYSKRIEEPVYNAAIKKLDIFFACYQNFYRSSNNLVKCAKFKKPVIVLNHGCMEQRVSKYKLGKVINTLDPKEIVNAIEGLLKEGHEFGDTAKFLDINDVKKVSEIIGQEYSKVCLLNEDLN